MTLSGVSASERKRRAADALAAVNLGDQLKKKHNQLSGGQMQRVAIARALVNNPDIILADEPTGALDSKTSVQIMDILKEVSKTRLVIMVTHNGDMAEAYSSRVIRLLDGEVKSDSNPLVEDEKAFVEPPKRKGKKMKTAMSLGTAISLSFKNLLTKKGRTIITALAGSIGIIGVALVLALSNGLSTYMNNMQSQALSGMPLSITTGEQMASFSGGPPSIMEEQTPVGLEKFTAKEELFVAAETEEQELHTNVLSEDYLNYIGKMENDLADSINTVSYTKGTYFNVLAKGEDTILKYDTVADKTGALRDQLMNNLYWQELPDNESFINSLYDVVGENSRLPKEKNEIALVVDEYNQIDKKMLEKLGMTGDQESYELSDFIGKTFLKVVPNNDFYQSENGIFSTVNPSEYSGLYDQETSVPLTITGILRPKEADSEGYLSKGLVYTKALTDFVVEDAYNSDIGKTQRESDKNVLTNTPFRSDLEKEQVMIAVGASNETTGINIYPKDFNSKETIKGYLEDYNKGKAVEEQIAYTDLAETVSTMMNTLLNTTTYVLTAFAAISLLVSTIMIALLPMFQLLKGLRKLAS